MVKDIIAVQDPVLKDRQMVGVHVETRILVEFLSEEGSDLVPLEDLTTTQLRVLVESLIKTSAE